MAHIKITRGLDIPIEGKPDGRGGEISHLEAPHLVALNLDPFDEMKFKILIRERDSVKLGQPLVEDKDSPGRYFVSPAGGWSEKFAGE